MQAILSIDTSVEPAQAVVVGVEGNSLRIIESVSFETEGVFSRDKLALNGAAAEASPQDADGAPLPDGQQPDGTGTPAGHPVLQKALDKLTSSWTTSILIIPTYDYLSLNLNLPFSEPAKINKIIDFEVQDMIPFDISEFLVSYRSISPLKDSDYDVHVSLIPKVYLKNILKILKTSKIEPVIVTTPVAALEGIYHVASDYFQGNSAIIFEKNDHYYIATRIDGQVRSDRILNTPSAANGDGSAPNLPLELKLTLAATERRYGQKVETVYYSGSADKVSELRAVLARSVEPLNLTELIKESDDGNALSGIAALFARDNQPPQVLTNFRTREFSYSPELSELLRGLKSLLPLFVATLILIFTTWGMQYYLRQSYIDRMRTAMKEQIESAIPGYTVTTGQELQGLAGMKEALGKELSNLGSQTALSPVEAFAEISKDIQSVSGINLNQITIKGKNLDIDISAPDYQNVDKLESALERNKTVYCKVKKESSSLINSGPKKFTFRIELCG